VWVLIVGGVVLGGIGITIEGARKPSPRCVASDFIQRIAHEHISPDPRSCQRCGGELLKRVIGLTEVGVSVSPTRPLNHGSAEPRTISPIPAA
jgi:hypothetical protein